MSPLLCLPVSCKYIYYYKSTNDPAFIQDLEFIFAIMLFPPALNETRHYTRLAVIQGNMVIIIIYLAISTLLATCEFLVTITKRSRPLN